MSSLGNTEEVEYPSPSNAESNSIKESFKSRSIGKSRVSKGQSGVPPVRREESQCVLREGVLGLEGGVDARRVPGGKSSINGHLSVAGFAGLLTQCRCLGDAVILAIPKNELPFLLGQGSIPPGPSMRGELLVEIGWCHWFVSTEVKVGRLLGTEGVVVYC